MGLYAVIDTNVLVSALLKVTSIPGQIAAQALLGELTPLLNDEIVAEYREVLHRPKFRFKPELINVLIDGIIERGLFLNAGPIEDIVPDPKDIVFYAVVMEKRKEDDAYLVTGNIKHFPSKPFVVTPKEMMVILQKNSR